MRSVICPNCGRTTEKLEVLGRCEHCGGSAVGGPKPVYVEDSSKLASLATQDESGSPISKRHALAPKALMLLGAGLALVLGLFIVNPVVKGPDATPLAKQATGLAFLLPAVALVFGLISFDRLQGKIAVVGSILLLVIVYLVLNGMFSPIR